MLHSSLEGAQNKELLPPNAAKTRFSLSAVRARQTHYLSASPITHALRIVVTLRLVCAHLSRTTAPGSSAATTRFRATITAIAD
ncbi:hypothetical protein AK830_g1740 [Neonectria ditissima]|uniref:Uncharacterized protein n=1 Tax=Neonectria ditissima TaxID=78410 RepID=A0A0P7BTR0_9HYPO|nr:hypothetical protein AK830_g1740 [Neonectria ditissima]